MTQINKIESYLKGGGKLTPLQALEQFGCFRLAAVIHTLKARSLNIQTEIIEVETTHGKAEVAQYRIAS